MQIRRPPLNDHLPSPCFIGAVESFILVDFLVLKVGVLRAGPIVTVSRLVVILVAVAPASSVLHICHSRGIGILVGTFNSKLQVRKYRDYECNIASTNQCSSHRRSHEVGDHMT